MKNKLIYLLIFVLVTIISSCNQQQKNESTTNKSAPVPDKFIETVSGQAPYTLPRDHKFHGGGIYNTGYLEEWHYFTGYFTDDETGEELGLFYNIFREGEAPGKLRHRLMFSLGNLKTKEFVWAGRVLPDTLIASAPENATSPDDFQYVYGTPSSQTSFTTIYHAKNESWKLQCKTIASSPEVPFGIDLDLQVTKPFGYMAVTPTGMEPQNIPWVGAIDQQTMMSNSYYYAAPKISAKGTVSVNGKVRHITGSLWLEHQWGNFEFSKTPWATTYLWSAFQFNDGSIFTFRDWFDEKGKWLSDIGRHSYSTPDGKTSYGFGASVKWEGLKTWKSPVSGHVFPTSGRVSTPYGIWYYSAVFNPYEMPIGFPPFGKSEMTLFEGAVYLRSGSIDGPIIGKAFLELPSGLTKTYPEIP